VSAKPSERQFIRAVLVLPVAEMRTARDWYASVLGFETVFLNADPVEDPDGNYAILRRDGAEMHLILDDVVQNDGMRDHPWSTAGTAYLFLQVRDVDAVHQQVIAAGGTVRRGIERQDWGARAFQLTDPSGNLILVAEESPS
jgi:uncharacterized glyoxalase superfamily protein PhnB